MFEARRWDSEGRQPVGTFTSYPSGVRAIACYASDDALTHTASSLKSDISVQWIPPGQDISSIVFVATVVQSKEVYWVDIYSNIVTGERYRGTDSQLTIYQN